MIIDIDKELEGKLPPTEFRDIKKEHNKIYGV